ncbi:hypothetical protein JTE90_002625 [Oedothorax gibbosus]|uniref:Ig-like domain-containing protein n=1 Tax=Oedothorax gibbosus TaxID=931172 RepID=A0AAV6VID5_9ARAC|nr:hypothetical protein JTE90_002625 [Oedothorax gibbosus]
MMKINKNIHIMFITVELIVFLVPFCLGRVLTSTSSHAFGKKLFLENKAISATKRQIPPTLNIRNAPSEILEIMAGDNKFLECEVGGTPPPTIHWLKDGLKVSQSMYEADVMPSTLGLGFTRSRLFLDCVSPFDAGKYTCVAENEYKRASRTSQVLVEDNLEAENDAICLAKKSFGSPARIQMWTHTRLEIMGTDVQLFCRVSGEPQPRVVWRGPNKKLLVDPKKYQVMPSGDLVIKNIMWSDMGGYICEASNAEGSDEAMVFLYPTMPEGDGEA